jgi:conjugal transfer/entry exclusion protein
MIERKVSSFTEAELEDLLSRAAMRANAQTLEHIEKLDKRIKSLEDALKSGQGVLIGAAAVIGFLLADGIVRIKAFMGIAS